MTSSLLLRPSIHNVQLSCDPQCGGVQGEGKLEMEGVRPQRYATASGLMATGEPHTFGDPLHPHAVSFPASCESKENTPTSNLRIKVSLHMISDLLPGLQSTQV